MAVRSVVSQFRVVNKTLDGEGVERIFTTGDLGLVDAIVSAAAVYSCAQERMAEVRTGRQCAGIEVDATFHQFVQQVLEGQNLGRKSSLCPWSDGLLRRQASAN